MSLYRAILTACMSFVLYSSAYAGNELKVDHAELPVVEVHTIEAPVNNYDQLARESDAIVRAKLVDIVDGYRYPQDLGNPSEFVQEVVGLVFEVTKLLDGDVTSTQITVAWPAYDVYKNTKSNYRANRLSTNGITFTENENINTEYLFAITYLEEDGCYQFYSTDILYKVNADSTISRMKS